MMRTTIARVGSAGAILLVLPILLACEAATPSDHEGDHGEGSALAETGPHGGRLLESDGFEVEIALVDHPAGAELRAWTTRDGQPVDPAEVTLHVALARLGGNVDEIAFEPTPDAGFSRGTAVIAEPHSFEVSVAASVGSDRHEWRYDSFEGRTRIDSEVARTLGVATDVAGPARLKDVVTLYGRVSPDPERVRSIRARFDGVVRSVRAPIGHTVSKGDPLLTIESNESLNAYTITAPISGVVTFRDANPGEQTGGRLLLTITDPSVVWVDLSVFPTDRSGVAIGSDVSIVATRGDVRTTGEISIIDVLANEDQSLIARAVIDNADGALIPGHFVSAEVVAAEYEVDVAVERAALQSSGGWPVVYVRVGDEYEARRVELGRTGVERVEVLAGLEAGARYVTEHSYLIKADIEKSGAAHAH